MNAKHILGQQAEQFVMKNLVFLSNNKKNTKKFVIVISAVLVRFSHKKIKPKFSALTERFMKI